MMLTRIVITAALLASCSPAPKPEPKPKPEVDPAPIATVAPAGSVAPREAPMATESNCDIDQPAVALDLDTVALIEHEPMKAAQRLEAYDKNDFSHVGRLAYEIARWIANSQDRGYFAHLEALGAGDDAIGLQCGWLHLADVAARAQAGLAAWTAFSYWMVVQSPRALSTRELALAVAVYDELLSDDHQELMLKLLHGVLAIDPNAGAIAKSHVGTHYGDNLIAFLHDMKKKYPTAKWVAEIARDIPNLATVGDLKDAAVTERLARAMNELGGVPLPDARKQLKEWDEDACGGAK